MSTLITIRFTDTELESLQGVLNDNPRFTRTGLIKHRVLGRREVSPKAVPVADMTLLGKLSGLVNCMLDDYRKGKDVIGDIVEAKELLDTHIQGKGK